MSAGLADLGDHGQDHSPATGTDTNSIHRLRLPSSTSPLIEERSVPARMNAVAPDHRYVEQRDDCHGRNPGDRLGEGSR